VQAQVPGLDFRADVGQPAELSRSSRRRRRTRGEFTGFWELRKAGLPHAATNGILQQCGFISAVVLNKMHAAFGETRFRDSHGLVAGALDSSRPAEMPKQHESCRNCYRKGWWDSCDCLGSVLARFLLPAGT